ncbi:AI-2 transport protein TqsA [Pseudobythopirellula maris]|uniref:AI-2 transport protein TqsA n=1 Tax=Pseudobythopirellula maris TaxID=2527991 RepID=A0A5C5ZHF5_9BACT|nr:AI-2E family transporter [Pseudobythopirellula maris]TWT86774.1 AI-2 transport protein TqsA [Pseudobythopirellula maris]
MPDTPPVADTNRELQWQSRCLMVLTVLAIAYALHVLSGVLIPFVLALFFTVGLTPLLDLIERRLNASRFVAVTISFLLSIVLLTLLSLAIGSSVNSLAQDDKYQESVIATGKTLVGVAKRYNLIAMVDDDQSVVKKMVADGSDSSASDESEGGATSEDGSQATDSAGPEQGQDLQAVGEQAAESSAPMKQLLEGLRDTTQEMQKWLLGEMLGLFSTLSMVLLYMFFMLLGASGGVRPTEGVWPTVEDKLREYVVLKSFISVVTGVSVWLVMIFFGVPLAMVMGLLTFLLNFIPNFGPLITCVLPLPVIWMMPTPVEGETIGMTLLGKAIASVLVCGVQLIGGNVIEPKMMGDSFELHPITVLLALVLWGAIWGFVGMLLAVPITAAIKILLDRVDRTRAIAQVMAGDLEAIRVG